MTTLENLHNGNINPSDFLLFSIITPLTVSPSIAHRRLVRYGLHTANRLEVGLRPRPACLISLKLLMPYLNNVIYVKLGHCPLNCN